MVRKAVLIALFVLLSPTDVFAARSITISSDKSSLFGDEEMQISIVTSGFTDGETIYIKGAFYQDGTTNYFGYTKNGDPWIKNGESTISQRQVKIGSWDSKLITKSDFSDSGYKGEGDYKFKVGFYYTTSGGNLSSVNWSSNILNATISEPDPTPSPALTPTPAPALTPSPTPIKSPTPTPKPSPSTLKLSSPTPQNSPQVLAQKDQATVTASPTSSPTESPGGQNPSKVKIASILIGSGLILIGFSAAFYFWYRKTVNLPEEEKEKSED